MNDALGATHVGASTVRRTSCHWIAMLVGFGLTSPVPPAKVNQGIILVYSPYAVATPLCLPLFLQKSILRWMPQYYSTHWACPRKPELPDLSKDASNEPRRQRLNRPCLHPQYGQLQGIPTSSNLHLADIIKLACHWKVRREYGPYINRS